MPSGRQAARAVVLDSQNRVLLLRARDPFQPRKGSWWELPGGGLDPGESSGEAAAREIYEETGLTGFTVGPCVWRHRARFTFAGLVFDQLEHIHVARWAGPPAAEVGGEDSRWQPAHLEALEAMAFSGISWWDADQLYGLAGAGEVIIPPWLPEQLPLYLQSGDPEEPIDLGELGPVFPEVP